MNLLRTNLSALATSLTLAAPGMTQNAVPLVRQGDLIPGVGNVTFLQRAWVNSAGDWLVEVDTDAPNGTDNALLLNGNLILREGDTVSAPGGTVFVIDGVDLDEFGRVLVNHTLVGAPGGSAANSAVYLDGGLVALEGDAVTAPQVGAGTAYRAFDSVDMSQTGYALLRGMYTDPTVPGSTETFVLKAMLDAGGSILSEEVVGFESQVAPGTTDVIQNVRLRHREAALGACGDVIWGADLQGNVASDGAVFFNDSLVAREGSPTGFGGVWGELDGYEVDVNDAGDWALSDSRGDGSRVIAVNGQLFVEEGDTLPGIAPFSITAIGGQHVEIDDAGRVLWLGTWSDPNPDNVGIFLDDRLLVQRGVTLSNGTPLQAIGDNVQSYSVSPNGRFVVFEGALQGGTNAFFMVDLGIGDNYCTSSANSTDLPAVIHASGTTSISDNDLTLIASNLPMNQTGLIYFGPDTLQVPFGNGVRCVGGTQVYRLPTQAISKSGIMAHRLDYLSAPVVGVVVAGTTWNFQAWFRDPAAGGAFFDLSNALTLTFES